MQLVKEIEITSASVALDGRPVAVRDTGNKMLVELYRRYVGDYPKFFKMDTLCRLGFMAAELLLDDCAADAVILANSSASIKNDTDYLTTISDGNYYPSPALFVYTLPNIVTGEIAIRHHIQGETSFYVLPSPELLNPIVEAALKASSANVKSVLAGWCDCRAADDFFAKVGVWSNDKNYHHT